MKKQEFIKFKRWFYRSCFANNDDYVLKFYCEDTKEFELVGRSGVKFLVVPNILGMSYKKRKKIFNFLVRAVSEELFTDENKILQNIFCSKEVQKSIESNDYYFPVCDDERLITYETDTILQSYYKD